MPKWSNEKFGAWMQAAQNNPEIQEMVASSRGFMDDAAWKLKNRFYKDTGVTLQNVKPENRVTEGKGWKHVAIPYTQLQRIKQRDEGGGYVTDEHMKAAKRLSEHFRKLRRENLEELPDIE